MAIFKLKRQSGVARLLLVPLILVRVKIHGPAAQFTDPGRNIV